MTNEDEMIKRYRKEAACIAEAMLSGSYPTLEGVRRICEIRFLINDPENKVFIPFRGIESETDEFPTGSLRSRFNEAYLLTMDKELEEYLYRSKCVIINACKSLIDEFEG